ncbi:C-C motif chemokine 14-like [Glossophaga mutica]
MKLSAAALPFLILAAALGPPAHASLRPGSLAHGGHRPSDCCLSYTYRIECMHMVDYFLTSSECPRPAVVFIPKMGQGICASPHIQNVRFCMEDLDSAKNKLAEEKLQ